MCHRVVWGELDCGTERRHPRVALSQFQQCFPEVAERPDVRGVEPDDLSVLIDGLREPAKLSKGVAQAEVAFGRVGGQPHLLAKAAGRFGEFTASFVRIFGGEQDESKVEVAPWGFGLQSYGLAVLPACLVLFPLAAQNGPDVEMSFGEIRLQVQSLAKLPGRPLELIPAEQNSSQVEVSLRKDGSEPDRLAVLPGRLCILSRGTESVSQEKMGLGAVGLDPY